tara:strand:- start:9570 stop:9791 length:222 start_codon:yes stop_codon:yes gene_type:complete
LESAYRRSRAAELVDSGNLHKRIHYLPPKAGQKIDWFEINEFYDDGEPKPEPVELSEKGKALLLKLSLTSRKD